MGRRSRTGCRSGTWCRSDQQTCRPSCRSRQGGAGPWIHLAFSGTAVHLAEVEVPRAELALDADALGAVGDPGVAAPLGDARRHALARVADHALDDAVDVEH